MGHGYHMVDEYNWLKKPNDMPNYRINVNWSTSKPMEKFFDDKDLELSKRAQNKGIREER